MANSSISIEPKGSHDTGICACCGRSSRRVWGFAHAQDRPVAVYYVHWTLGHVPENGANIDLIFGEWGDEAPVESRYAVALAYRLLDSGPTFMVIDAETRPVADPSFVGRALRRDDVIGTTTADKVFAIADAVLAQDERIAEILGGWTFAG